MTIRKLALGDALELLIDNRGKNPPFEDTGIPVVSGMSVRPGGGLELSTSRRVSDVTYQKWMPEPTRPNDVILTSEAPLGRVALVKSPDPLLIGQRVFCMRGRRDVLDSRYLYYALQTESVQNDLRGRATGTTVVGIRQPELRRVQIPAPEFNQQVGIAECLGSLDDKIAVNARILKLSLNLADLQFARFAVGLPFGPMAFEDVASVGGGGTPRTSTTEYWDGSVHWATPTDVTGLAAPYLRRTGRRITEEGLAACSSRLYPAGSILMTSRATVGAFAVAQVALSVNQGFIVVNAAEPINQWWLFHEMRSRVNEFLSYANGATFLELPRGKFKRLPVRMPSPEKVRAFASTVAPLHEMSAQLMAETEKVAATRDELLPLLISGRLRVQDAEKVVEKVV